MNNTPLRTKETLAVIESACITCPATVYTRQKTRVSESGVYNFCFKSMCEKCAEKKAPVLLLRENLHITGFSNTVESRCTTCQATIRTSQTINGVLRFKSMCKECSEKKSPLLLLREYFDIVIFLRQEELRNLS